MPTPPENRTTEDLISQLALYITHATGIAMREELEYRLIKENDADDSPQHRGGARPTHQPLNP